MNLERCKIHGCKPVLYEPFIPTPDPHIEYRCPKCEKERERAEKQNRRDHAGENWNARQK